MTEINVDQDRREGFSDAFSIQTPVAENKIHLGTKDEASKEIKKVSKAFGAGLVGITKYDSRWEYSQ